MARRQSGVNINARFSVRDFILMLSMLGVGGNLFWCWQHDKEIQELRRSQPQTEKSQNAFPMSNAAFYTGDGEPRAR